MANWPHGRQTAASRPVPRAAKRGQLAPRSCQRPRPASCLHSQMKATSPTAAEAPPACQLPTSVAGGNSALRLEVRAGPPVAYVSSRGQPRPIAPASRRAASHLRAQPRVSSRQWTASVILIHRHRPSKAHPRGILPHTILGVVKNNHTLGVESAPSDDKTAGLPDDLSLECMFDFDNPEYPASVYA